MNGVTGYMHFNKHTTIKNSILGMKKILLSPLNKAIIELLLHLKFNYVIYPITLIKLFNYLNHLSHYQLLNIKTK